MKIALFSPVKPIKSGIADYTEELLPYLSKYLKIDLYIAANITPSSPTIDKYCQIKEFQIKNFNPAEYHQIVYHFGNSYHSNQYIYQALSNFPGIIILHDYILLGFYTERFFAHKDSSQFQNLLVKYYQKKGQQIAEELASRLPVPIWNRPEGINYPMNNEIISSAKGLIVHSNFVKNKIRKKYSLPIAVIPHHNHEEETFDNQETRKYLGLRKDDILICSAGFINQNKRFHIVIPALLELNNKKIKYLIIGKDQSNILKRLLRTPQPNLIIKGYLPLKEMERYISAADICINLRFPTMGESSGSLLRMMGYQKPILVSDCGSYSEFPAYSMIKINTDIYEKELFKAYINELVKNKDLRISLGKEAYQYVKSEHDINKCAKKYADFIINFK